MIEAKDLTQESSKGKDALAVHDCTKEGCEERYFVRFPYQGARGWFVEEYPGDGD